MHQQIYQIQKKLGNEEKIIVKFEETRYDQYLIGEKQYLIAFLRR